MAERSGPAGGGRGDERSAGAIERRRRFHGGVLELDAEDLLEIVPQRPPLLLLDRVLALVPGEHAVALKHVCGDEAGLDHHRHGFVFPSTFAAEALTQLAQLVVSGVAVPEDRTPAARLDAETWPSLVAIDALTVHQELLEPGSLHLTVSKLEERSEDPIDRAEREAPPVDEESDDPRAKRSRASRPVGPWRGTGGVPGVRRAPSADLPGTLVTCAAQATIASGLFLEARFVLRRPAPARA